MDVLQLCKPEERTIGLYSPSLLDFWRQDHTGCTVWRHLAFKLFAIPVSASADERNFPIADNSIGNDRPRTPYEFAEAQRILSS
jgi:hypothetical protein